MPCYVRRTKDHGFMILCGNLGPHCATGCGDVGAYLCDYPVGEGKTCDKPLCSEHASEVAPDIHYCPGHFRAWEEFRASGGVKAELENVRPFPSPRG